MFKRKIFMKKYLLVFASLSVLLMSACNPADLVAGAVKNNAANAIKAGTANGAVGTEIVTKAQFLKYYSFFSLLGYYIQLQYN